MSVGGTADEEAINLVVELFQERGDFLRFEEVRALEGRHEVVTHEGVSSPLRVGLYYSELAGQGVSAHDLGVDTAHEAHSYLDYVKMTGILVDLPKHTIHPFE